MPTFTTAQPGTKPLLQLHVRGLRIYAQSVEGGVVDLAVCADQQHRSAWGRFRQHLARALFRAGDLCHPGNDNRAIRVVVGAVPLKPVDYQLPDWADPGPRKVVPLYDALGNAHYQALVIHERVEHHDDGLLTRLGRVFGRQKGTDDTHRDLREVDLSGFENAIVQFDPDPAEATTAPVTFPAWIAAQQWDGTPRLDTWLAKVLRSEPSAYLSRAGRYIVMGHVARALDPGCRFDYVPLLYGPPGTGKSSLPRVLVGPAHFNDSHLDLSKRPDLGQLEGIYAYEMAEMTAFRPADAAAVKAFLTARTDTYRRAYGSHMQMHPRTCIVWATCNVLPTLAAGAMERRFWPLHAPSSLDLEWLRDVRGQLFAEAHEYLTKRGESHLPTEEEELQIFAPAQALHLARHAQAAPHADGSGSGVTSMWGSIDVWVLALVQPGEFVTVTDLMQRAGLAPGSTLSECAMRDALLRTGFTPTREMVGMRRRGYRAPAKVSTVGGSA